jgi:G:T-mismatch repair DNA endonuclease (very short patch repair protein)
LRQAPQRLAALFTAHWLGVWMKETQQKVQKVQKMMYIPQKDVQTVHVKGVKYHCKKAHLHHVPDVGVKEEVRAALAAAGCALHNGVVGRINEPTAENTKTNAQKKQGKCRKLLINAALLQK